MFLTRKILPKEKIIIDYREKNSLVASELVHLGLQIEFKELKVADYLVKNIAIERKTINDFIFSMTKGRLLNQIEELKQYEDKLLIIEGFDEQELYSDDNHSGMNANSIRGFLLSILLKHKIPIIFTKDQEDTTKFILILSKKKKRESPLNIKKKSLNKKERLQFIIESFAQNTHQRGIGLGKMQDYRVSFGFHSLVDGIENTVDDFPVFIPGGTIAGQRFEQHPHGSPVLVDNHIAFE